MMATTFSRKTIATFLLPLGALLFLELVPLLNVSELTQPSSKVAPVTTLSGQTGLGAIDEKAVMVVADGDIIRAIPLCGSLPESAWIFLVCIYVLLMAFNLREQYRLYGDIRYWRFEALITAFFLFEWLVFDTCREQAWFPLTLIKSGLILVLIFEIKSLYQNLVATPEQTQD
ncbi:MAG: hypothetical protein AAB845_00900 [Patescibacteria group bacterium]